MPLFMVKKEVFRWIRLGRKTVELRKGKAKSYFLTGKTTPKS
jgi:hypothetical protein